MLEQWRRQTNVVSLILAVVLFVTPWVFGFATGAAAWNAWISALLIGLLAVSAIAAFAEWEEWLSLLLGLWVAVSPWVIGFHAAVTPRWVHVVLGLIVAAIAAVELWKERQTPRMA